MNSATTKNQHLQLGVDEDGAAKLRRATGRRAGGALVFRKARGFES